MSDDKPERVSIDSDRYFFAKYLERQEKREDCIKISINKATDAIVSLDTKQDMLHMQNEMMLKIFKWLVGLVTLMVLGVFLLVGVDLTKVVPIVSIMPLGLMITSPFGLLRCYPTQHYAQLPKKSVFFSYRSDKR